MLKDQDDQKKKPRVSWYVIFYKLGFGLAELLLGLGIAVFGHQAFRLYLRLVSNEISEDPHDLLVNITSKIIPGLLTHNTFLVLYLILLGSVKIAGSIGLIYRQNWGVDLLVLLTIILFPFQATALLMHPSFFDFFYITLGLFIALYLIEFNPRAWVLRLFKR